MGVFALGETGSVPDQVPDKKGSQGIQVTRRDFLVGAGAGAVTAGAVLGGAIVVKNAVSPETTSITATPKPTTAQIAEGLAGNICRCGEYAKIYTAVQTAAAEMRGEKVTHLATAIAVGVAGTAEAAPSAAGVSKEFTFDPPLGTIE